MDSPLCILFTGTGIYHSIAEPQKQPSILRIAGTREFLFSAIGPEEGAYTHNSIGTFPNIIIHKAVGPGQKARKELISYWLGLFGEE